MSTCYCMSQGIDYLIDVSKKGQTMFRYHLRLCTMQTISDDPKLIALQTVTSDRSPRNEKAGTVEDYSPRNIPCEMPMISMHHVVYFGGMILEVVSMFETNALLCTGWMGT